MYLGSKTQVLQVPRTSSNTTAPKPLAGARVETTTAAALPATTGRPAATEHQAARTAEAEHQLARARMQPTRLVWRPDAPSALEPVCVYVEACPATQTTFKLTENNPAASSTPSSDTTVTAPMPGPPAPTKYPTIGTAAHRPEDPEGLTDQSNKICNGGPLGAYPEGEVNKVRGTLLTEDAVYYGPISSARRGGCCCEVSPAKEGISFTKKPSRDYQSSTGSNSRIDLYVQ
ncbi:hypothetical protein Taro_043005 [Colocasia esculenta]|uniref:Uncharacterized protein n=1 Tax=Colocasia esculenta TaxID=4460 RepID=A0A843WR05_COLES|nr:hypothetical protein [Colocasia esculenta]